MSPIAPPAPNAEQDNAKLDPADLNAKASFLHFAHANKRFGNLLFCEREIVLRALGRKPTSVKCPSECEIEELLMPLNKAAHIGWRVTRPPESVLETLRVDNKIDAFGAITGCVKNAPSTIPQGANLSLGFNQKRHGLTFSFHLECEEQVVITERFAIGRRARCREIFACSKLLNGDLRESVK